jgi:hypothetical protein
VADPGQVDERDELTIQRSATSRFFGELLRIHLEGSDAKASERVEELRPRKASDLGGTCLGHDTHLVPLDGGGNAQLARERNRIFPEGRKMPPQACQ